MRACVRGSVRGSAYCNKSVGWYDNDMNGSGDCTVGGVGLSETSSVVLRACFLAPPLGENSGSVSDCVALCLQLIESLVGDVSRWETSERACTGARTSTGARKGIGAR